MRVENLIAQHNQLYHMAEDGSWPSIKTHGLLSTSALLKKWEYPKEEIDAICRHHRPDSIPIEHDVYGKAVLRDQKAIDTRKLRGCLTDVTEENWYLLLNSKVFFWPDWRALKWFLQATAYFQKPHVVITIDTRSLLEEYSEKITLSAINSGSTIPKRNQLNPELRGINTFKSVLEYQSKYFRELAVDGGIDNIGGFVLAVDRLVVRIRDAEPERLASLWAPSPK